MGGVLHLKKLLSNLFQFEVKIYKNTQGKFKCESDAVV